MNDFSKAMHYFSALPNVPYSLDYWYNKKDPKGPSRLYFGDDKGAINILHFTEPTNQIFENPFKERGSTTNKIFFQVSKLHLGCYIVYQYSGLYSLELHGIRKGHIVI